MTLITLSTFPSVSVCEIFPRLIAFLRNYTSSRLHDKLYCIWHGIERMGARARVLPSAHYFARCRLQKKMRRFGILFPSLCLTFGTIPCSLGMGNGHGQPAISLSRKFHGLVNWDFLCAFVPFLTGVLRNPLPDMTNFEHCMSRLLKGRLPVC